MYLVVNILFCHVPQCKPVYITKKASNTTYAEYSFCLVRMRLHVQQCWLPIQHARSKKIAHHMETFPYLLELLKHWHCSKCLNARNGISALIVPVAHMVFNENDSIVASSVNKVTLLSFCIFCFHLAVFKNSTASFGYSHLQLQSFINNPAF